MRFVRDMAEVSRPCFPDDIVAAVKHLRGRRVLGRAHLDVLSDYGYRERPPDPRYRDEAEAHRLWDQALDRLTTVLQAKEIVQ
ncbi:MAG: hypothetical protein VW405_18700 [Rhodospirillaceae bacterium]